MGLIPESQRYPGEENNNQLQYSCLENSMDIGTWHATVHWVRVRHNWAQALTCTDAHTHTHTHTHTLCRKPLYWLELLVTEWQSLGLWCSTSVTQFCCIYKHYFKKSKYSLAFSLQFAWLLISFHFFSKFGYENRINFHYLLKFQQTLGNYDCKCNCFCVSFSKLMGVISDKEHI